MTRDIQGLAQHRKPMGIHRKLPSDTFTPSRSLTAGQIAARLGATETTVLRVIERLGIEAVDYHPDIKGGCGYSLEALRLVRVELKYGGSR